MEVIEKQRSGQRLTNAKRTVLIAKMFEQLSNGYMSTNALAKQCKVATKTIDTYRPLVDQLIADKKLDRNVIRNLELQRAYKVIELLMDDLKEVNEAFKDIEPNPDITSMKIKTKNLLYSQIAKHSSRIALITGLNVETHVNVDHQQLVIIRADNNKRPRIIDSETETLQPKVKVTLPTVLTDPPLTP